jgi:hypothetical protein
VRAVFPIEMVAIGAVLSNTTDDALVVAVTCVPAFDAISEKVIVNGIAPVVLPSCITYVDVNGPVVVPVVVAFWPAMVTTGSPNASLALNVSVIVSPTFASVVLALFEAILTEVRVGAVVSVIVKFAGTKVIV